MNPVERLFEPRSIAVFGASGGQGVGGLLYRNLLDGGFEGKIYPINPSHRRVRGKTCHPNLQSLGQRVDLALIATPAASVPGIFDQLAENGVRAAVVLSAGFLESGSSGASLESDLVFRARRNGIRFLGPNCLGFMVPRVKLNATFSRNKARPGKLALLSQSGALCTAILDWAEPRGIGFSSVVSLGDAANIGFGDLLDHYAMDEATSAILVYVEGIRHARSFVTGLRAAARLKPVIVIKSGRRPEGSRAALTHTGAIVGEDDVFESVLQRAGAVRVARIDQLFAAARILSTGQRTRGNRLAVVTNAGGAGVMAADHAGEHGVTLPQLSEATLEALDEVMPANYSRGNPLDVLGDADAGRFTAAAEACLADESVDGVLVMLAPVATSEPNQVAEQIIALAPKARGKPLLTCWLGDKHVSRARASFDKAGIACFENPEEAVEAFSYLAGHERHQELLTQVPEPREFDPAPDLEGAELIIDGVIAEGRRVLNELESKALLKAFHVPIVPAFPARDGEDALAIAETLGFPVAMKILSPDIVHKSEVGGVRLDIRRAGEVRQAYNDLLARVRKAAPDAHIEGVLVERMYTGSQVRELNLGILRDPAFGPVISFGAGGTAVEILRDRAVSLPPLNDFISRRLIEGTRVSRLLSAFRDWAPVPLDPLLATIQRVSDMACEVPRLRELDINPLVADAQGVIALDARIVVDHDLTAAAPYHHLAIHPYPREWVRQRQLAGGTQITLRPIRPEDALIEQDFVRKLSTQSKYFRFMHAIRELTPQMLVRFTQIDYDREMALIACVREDGREIEVGVTRYVGSADRESCEFALVVADDWQGHGIGTALLRQLIEVARDGRFRWMEGEILTENRRMQTLVTNLGFTLEGQDEDPAVLKARLSLQS